MNSEMFGITGLKAVCGACTKEFSVSRIRQRKLFEKKSIVCASCRSIQMLSQEQIEALRGKGNPGLEYEAMMAFFGVVSVFYHGSLVRDLVQGSLSIRPVDFILASSSLTIGILLVGVLLRHATREIKVELTTHHVN
ncbi:hypothetical protein [Pseudomonas viridiflava]|uniref:hypothetical protein n=1 Tax=Pseudomonas viridiflava TaxID=33069 RepID=UPI0012DF5A3C|nr:hypothetical protein [Pseudomonas viridiflava]MEE4151751.1 hypothetical protein [Pseudomonas viridiflava]